MGIFTDIYCAVCKEKAGVFTRTKLTDGSYICSKCLKIVPSYMRKSFYSIYDLDDYHALSRYVDYSNDILRPLFHETHKYYSIHIDTEHLIFYIGDWIDDKTLFLRFDHLADFDLVYHADEYKEGMVGNKVYGRLLLKVKMNYPYFYYETKLDEKVKAKAKKTFFGTKIEYENPKGMDDFLLHFFEAWKTCLADPDLDDEDDDEFDDEHDETLGGTQSSELAQAMALFMIDDLSAVTPSELKEQRNRLIKTFHPDKATANDTKYAQKINSAYDILKKHVE